MYHDQELRGCARSRASAYSILSLVAVLALVCWVFAPRPAHADAGASELHIAVTDLQFTSITCLNSPACSLYRSVVAGDASSNLSMGNGSYQATLLVDFSPGGTCNIVDDSGASTFGNGTIFTHSYHEDCATHGLRIDTTFQVTGGTGAFAGASGGGREWSSTGAASPVFFQGKISF
jgi:hypothetical protein